MFRVPYLKRKKKQNPYRITLLSVSQEEHLSRNIQHGVIKLKLISNIEVYDPEF